MWNRARYLNILLGAWLFLSAFLWRHSDPQFTNTWLMGVLCVAFALTALAVPAARYLNTALAIWLFISAFALPRINNGTVWNNALSAIAIFLVSLTGRGPEMVTPRRPARTVT